MEPQSFSYWRSEFIKREVLEARTFGFMSDLEPLRAQNLARGSSLDNTIAFSDDGSVLNKEGLRFSKEPSMHKGLDALGDLRLGGVLSGRYESLRPGHGLNIILLKKLFSSAKNFKLI
uniref:UDP-3-O-acyl-N-acetylglucosamine deacetylase n=1 Tax=Rhodosorus marinus TaxID=101924 RepID=A0A7S0BGP4_9RHOD|mmetsp:Transcript_15911/g.23225  ORF Transcript_15911/g.23225 Transcript_15911/m.23225 type:complete len:118 (+) Transcript_15911:736-1089(+)